MTSKNSYSDARGERGLAAWLVREKMRHSLWAISLFALLLFFSMTLPTAIQVQQLMERSQAYEWTRQQMLESGADMVSTVLGLGNGFTALLIAGMALVMAAACFRYLHNKNQVDFYHSLPLRRPWLFAANFGAGLASFAIAYFGNLLLSGLIALCAGFGKGLLTPAVGGAILLHCVFFLVIYAICVLGHQLAGVTATGVLCGGVLLAGPLAAFGLFIVYAQTLFRNFYLPESVLWRIGDFCSPLWAYMSRTFQQAEQYAGRVRWWAGAALCWLLAGLVIAALACWAYCRRPSESAGKAASFRLPAAVLKYFAVLLCTLAGGLLFRLVIGGRGWMIFGFCLGGLLSHCLVEIIYHLDFKALFCHIRAFGLFAALFAAIYLCLAMDIFHYDSYLPEADQVQSVSVNLDWLESYYSEYQMLPGRDDAVLTFLDRQTYRQPETIQAALELCRISREPYQEEPDDYYSTEVRYTLKSGRQVYRSYHVPRQAAKDQIMVLYDSREYKEQYVPLFQKEPGQFQCAVISLGMPNRPDQYLRQPGQAEQMAQALRQDLLAMEARQIEKKGPVATVTLSTDRDYGKEDREQWDSFETTVPIYDTYTNTLRVLAEQGVTTESSLRSYEVEKAYLWVDENSENAYDEDITESDLLDKYFSGDITAETRQDRAGEWTLLTDWEVIRQLLQKAVPESLAWQNPFLRFKQSNTWMRVVLNESQEREISYVFPMAE